MNKQALENWAKEALEFYNRTAPGIDLSFYQFQKPADFDHECDLLLIGLNPGGEPGWKFDSQYTNDGWKPSFKGTEMTYDGFLGGNPWWPNNHDWPIMRGLSCIGLDLKTLNGMNWQYINYIPFSTNNVSEFYGKANKFKKETGTDVTDRCLDLTAEYINLLSPKKIIVMGTANGIDKFPKKNKGESQTLLGGRIRYIIKTTLCGISTFAIAHPSFPNWSREAKAKMTEMIRQYFDNRENEIKSTRV